MLDIALSLVTPGFDQPDIANGLLCTYVTLGLEDKVLCKCWVDGGSSVAEVVHGRNREQHVEPL